ncbi:hypothetical protein JCM6882_006276 [Rhodosporidiobolus microsporus]
MPEAAAPLSAVAARRAAREAAQAASTKPTPPPRAAQPPPSLKDTAAEADGASSSADEDEVVKAGRASQAPKQAERSRTLANKAKGKGKAAAPPPSRYFAAPVEEQDDDEDDVMLLDQGDEAEDGDLSPPEGLDADEQEALGSMGGFAHDEEPATPKTNRRRREKSAFVDPFCVSSFQVVDGVSAARTQVIDPSNGVERGAVVYALQEGENLVFHGAFLLSPLFGSVTCAGATLTGPSSSSLPSLDGDDDDDELDVYALPSSHDALHPFFWPSSHPLTPVSALPPSEGYSPRVLSLASGEQLDLSRFAAAVLVLDHETGIEGVERALVVGGGMGCASGMWPRRGGKSSLAEGKTWKLITSPTPALTSLRPVPHWEHALSAAVPPLQEGAHDTGRFVALVEGPKRVGKSTMARTLVNALLDRYESVAYLDTDLGQPEFTAPGFLSLHVLRRPLFGPSFTHLALPLSAQYLGSTSPASDPAGYIAAAQALLETYALEVEYPLVDEPDRMGAFSRRRGGRFARMQAAKNGNEEDQQQQRARKIRERVPLVVNTQGWVKGLGADLLAKIKAASQPTHVFSFASPDDEGAAMPFDPYTGEAQQLPYRLFTLPPAPPSPLESKWSAADYRVLSLASYFHAVYPSPASASWPHPRLPVRWDFSLALAASTPYPFSWARDADPAQIHSAHLIAPGTADGEIKYEHVLHALNGSIVALVTPPPVVSSSPSPRPFPYDPSTSVPSLATCSRALGLALVHSISPSASTLNILTPLPQAVLAEHAPLSIVLGALELPTALMLDYSVGVSEGDRAKGVCGTPWGAGGRDGKDAGAGVPFLVKAEEEVGVGLVGGKRRVRRNLMRRGQA